MRIDLISIFPSYFDVLKVGLFGKAIENGTLEVNAIDLRNFAQGVHRSVDDTPLGGGAGMVMKPEVWARALESVIGAGDPLITYPSASSPLFTQKTAHELSKEKWIVVCCGRYEGIDERVWRWCRDKGWRVMGFCLGDYILSGGESAACVMLEAVCRLLPGFMGNAASLEEESYENGLLEHNQYTRPFSWRGMDAPKVLISGDHGKVDRYRRDESLKKTDRYRPDLIERLSRSDLDKADIKLLKDLGWDLEGDRPKKEQ
ncbi:MAG: tRNA (guanosine(37)-N1)-methyltransferase TrmD [Aeriscardovia sp.]|nr:tRNA (guanosine(37)-N1)-methyltransferase TrmD [Aeriscardovia sp.]